MDAGIERAATRLRQELSVRAIAWAARTRAAHEETLGGTPSVLFREDDDGLHGNFHPASYRRILSRPEWRRRLGKAHTSARRCLVSHDVERRELDSSHSSDALLMSIFCHPKVTPLAGSGLHTLLAVETDARLYFGYRPRIPLRGTGIDCTEADLSIGNLLIEAKLTEGSFQAAPRRRIERYRDVAEVFDLDALPQNDLRVFGYQVVRGALAAYAEADRRYCVICDRRRPDLVEAWYSVIRAVRPYGLRHRLQLLTWQEICEVLPPTLRCWLDEKYGIHA